MAVPLAQMLLLISFSCLTPEAEVVTRNEADLTQLSAANAKFALSLYRKVAASKRGNVFMSPFSISVAMAMTYAGARGETHRQMSDVMAFRDVSDAALNQAFADVRAALGQTGGHYTLDVANRLFAQQGFHFQQEFQNINRQFYGADVALVDFTSDAAAAVALVNKWVADQTNQTIIDLLQASDVNALTRLILVNAIYFKADWVNKFNTSLTKEEDFHISQTETIKVPLMYIETQLKHGYNPTLKAQAVRLPYNGNKLAMFIVLPDHVTGINEIEKALRTDDLLDIDDTFSMFPKVGKVWLPRFHMDESLSLAETLAGMGMSDLFSIGAADLSDMTGARNLYMSKVVHRAVVDVSEEGTTAAAATAAITSLRSAAVDDKFEFRADHPFVFFIQEQSTGAVIFLGRFEERSDVAHFSGYHSVSDEATKAAVPSRICWLLTMFVVAGLVYYRNM